MHHFRLFPGVLSDSVEPDAKGITMIRPVLLLATAVAVMNPVSAVAEAVVVPMYQTSADGVGPTIGTITIEDTKSGAVFRPALTGLTPGEHGFHVHSKPNCGAAMKAGSMKPGVAAAGHFDPENTGRHEGPNGSGHLGDLPRLAVAKDGTASEAVTAPRVRVRQIRGRALMVHAGGDNYSDEPSKLGGGGPRLACGVIR